MFISFRPLTEMVTVIGRSWLYPVAAHISFPVSTPSWKLEVTTTRLHQRAHLPYKSELFAPQSFLLYTLLRQPRGKDTISVSQQFYWTFEIERQTNDEFEKFRKKHLRSIIIQNLFT